MLVAMGVATRIVEAGAVQQTLADPEADEGQTARRPVSLPKLLRPMRSVQFIDQLDVVPLGCQRWQHNALLCQNARIQPIRE
jgi:hypothetical protein